MAAGELTDGVTIGVAVGPAVRVGVGGIGDAGGGGERLPLKVPFSTIGVVVGVTKLMAGVAAGVAAGVGNTKVPLVGDGVATGGLPTAGGGGAGELGVVREGVGVGAGTTAVGPGTAAVLAAGAGAGAGKRG